MINNSSNGTPNKIDRTVPAIEFRDVHLSFDDQKILNGISFKVRHGETKIILGRSGGGKVDGGSGRILECSGAETPLIPSVPGTQTWVCEFASERGIVVSYETVRR